MTLEFSPSFTARTLRVCLCVSLLALAGGEAQASVRKAKRLFKAGQTHYKLGEFAEALEKYSAAYQEKEIPAFLFNIGQCHMELKNFERAIFFLEGFLRESKPSAQNEVVEERLVEARAAFAAAEAQKQRLAAEKQKAEAAKRAQAEQQQEAAEHERQAAGERAAIEKKRLEIERLKAERKAAEANAALRAPVVEPAAPVYKKAWFWGIVGGVVAVAGGTAIALVATSGDTVITELPSGSLGTWDGR